MARQMNIEFGTIVTADSSAEPKPFEDDMSRLCRSQREKWNALARENDRFYCRSVSHAQSLAEYKKSGVIHVQRLIMEDRLLSALLSGHQNATVLEFGCGSGRMTEALADAFSRVIAVDIAEEMLDRAHMHIRRDNVEFLLSDGLRIPIPDRMVDFVYTSGTLQHFPAKSMVTHAFQEIFRILKPGGVFKAQLRRARHGSPDHWSWGVHYSRNEAINLAYGAGFRLAAANDFDKRALWLTLEKPEDLGSQNFEYATKAENPITDAAPVEFHNIKYRMGRNELSEHAETSIGSIVSAIASRMEELGDEDGYRLAVKCYDFAGRMDFKVLEYAEKYGDALSATPSNHQPINWNFDGGRDVICDALRKAYRIFDKQDDELGRQLTQDAFGYAKGLDKRLQLYKKRAEENGDP